MDTRQPARHYLSWLLIALACWIPGLASAQAGCGPYDVTYYEYGSFYFRSSTGEFTGIDKFLIEELAKRSGCVLNGVLDSRARTWARLEEGKLAITVSAIDTPERQKFAEFIPYFKGRNYVLVKTTHDSDALSPALFEANPKLRLAVVKSFKHGPAADAWIDRLRSKARVDEYPDAEVVARIVAIGRADAFLSEVGVWEPLLRHSGLENSVKPQDWFPNDGFAAGLAVSRTRVLPQDAKRLRASLQDMRRDGTLLKIFLRFLDAETANAALP